ncbi:MAG: M91 family zinc metallopeptidase [Bryobacteraceae bacterium]|jgi:hypothetical protein
MAIVIAGKVSNYKGHVRADFGAYPEWKGQVEAALAQIQNNRRGAQLYDEVNEAAKTVTIVRSLDGDQSNVTWVDGNVYPLYHAVEVDAINKALKIATRNEPELLKLKGRINQLAEKVAWKSATEVSAIILNEPGNQNLQYELETYDCLTAGIGMDCYIRWHPVNDFIGDSTLEKGAAENKWRTRPPWIGLAHELVHAWRFVAGRCIFTGNNLADEQLATGVPPYMLGKYNENGMRYYAFQIMRPYYGSTHGK